LKQLLQQIVDTTGVDLEITTGGEASNSVHRIRFREFPAPFGIELSVTRLPMSWDFTTLFDTFPGQLKNVISIDFAEKVQQVLQVLDTLDPIGYRMNLAFDGHKVTECIEFNPKTEIDFNGNFQFDPFPTDELSHNYLGALKDLISNWVLVWLILLENESKDSQSSDFTGEIEGAIKRGEFSWRERSRKNRAACLAEQGFSCGICGQNMADVYGEVAKTLIHVHHIIPVGSLLNPMAFDPRNDLIPLCPNCHYAAHVKSPPFTPDELRQLINNQKAGAPVTTAD
jgi:hypothetical protein